MNLSSRLNLFSACIHGACLVFLDAIDHTLPNRNFNGMFVFFVCIFLMSMWDLAIY